MLHLKLVNTWLLCKCSRKCTSSQGKYIGMYILPSIYSSHGHWKLGVAVRKCVKAGFPGDLLPGGIKRCRSFCQLTQRESICSCWPGSFILNFQDIVVKDQNDKSSIFIEKDLERRYLKAPIGNLFFLIRKHI